VIKFGYKILKILFDHQAWNQGGIHSNAVATDEDAIGVFERKVLRCPQKPKSLKACYKLAKS
jgi:hypothetical protein